MIIEDDQQSGFICQDVDSVVKYLKGGLTDEFRVGR